MGLVVKNHINTLFNSISYVILDTGRKNCWIIDVGDFDILTQIMNGYDLQAVFLTHIHYDHIYGLNHLYKEYPNIPIYTNTDGLQAISDTSENLSFFHGKPFLFNGIESIRIVKDKERIMLSPNLAINAFYTPGHHPSCITWDLEDNLFTGDSYIPGKKTFTKLPGGNKYLAEESLKFIHSLPDKIIYAGHHI